MFVTAIAREASVTSRDGFGQDQPRTVDAATCCRRHVTLECSPYQRSIIKAINSSYGRDG